MSARIGVVGRQHSGVSPRALRAFTLAPASNQQLRDLAIGAVRRPVQRRHAVTAGRVHVGSLLQQGPHRLEVARSGGVDQSSDREPEPSAPAAGTMMPASQRHRRVASAHDRNRMALDSLSLSSLRCVSVVISPARPCCRRSARASFDAEPVPDRQQQVGHRRAFGALRCRLPLIAPLAWPARNTGTRLCSWRWESPIGLP